eukprot:scaffold125238_cov37-Attheya_sp.AAC.1
MYKSDAGSVYTDPVKRVSEFGPGFNRFMESTRTVPAWISLFGLPPEAQPQTDEDGSALILRVDRVAPVGLTPMKKKARFLSEDQGSVEEEGTLDDLPEISGSDPQQVMSRIGSAWPVVQSNQKQIGSMIEAVRKKATLLASEVSQDMDSVDVLRFNRVNRVVGEWTDEFATS